MMHERPSSLSEFLSSGELQLGDIILFRRKGSFFATNLTRLSGDYFSHCALIFATPHTDPGFTKTYILECKFSGVDITPFEHFIKKRNAYVMCIKRLECPWFDARLRRAIRGHALNFIKAEYSFKTLTDLFLRAEAHLLFPKHKTSQHRAKALRQTLRRGFKLPNAFICSGFVQYAFYDAVRVANQSPTNLSDCYFANQRWTESLQADLLSVTPQDMADSEKLSWKYLIQNEEVTEVASQSDAMALIENGGRGWQPPASVAAPARNAHV